jgi:hypothetical protein
LAGSFELNRTGMAELEREVKQKLHVRSPRAEWSAHRKGVEATVQPVARAN